MNTAEKVEYWFGIADYDLDTAEAMYSTGRWLYVAFMCHQVIEKTLKAYWCATQENEPPYIHNSLYHVAEVARQHGVQFAVFYGL